MTEEQQPIPSHQTSSETPENSLSQAELTERLQQVIGQLQNIVTQLQTDTVAMPSKTSVETLVASTEALATSLQKKPTPTEIAPETVSVEPTPREIAELEPFVEGVRIQEEADSKLGWIDRFLPSFNRLQAWWDGLLGKVRSLLPEFLSEKLSDWALTGILTGITVTLLLTSVLLVSRPSTPAGTEVAKTPPAVVETPPLLTAPSNPQPIEIAPPPEPELTPEQSLIASIQEEVAQITSSYAEGIIGTIEADFLQSRLIVTVGDNWYQLNQSKQDRLASEILRRSQRLDFRKLEIVNPEGVLLARNPVVGDKMIILQRTNSAEISRK